MKCVVSFVLAVLLMISGLPILSVQASEQEPGQAAFAQLCQSYDPGESAYAGTAQLVSHAVLGGGKDLLLGPEDAFAGLVMHSNLMEAAVTAAVRKTLAYLERNQLDSIDLSGSLEWYDELVDSYYYIQGTDTVMAGGRPQENNAYDKAMILIGGTVLTKMQFRRAIVTADTVTYRINCQFYDDFDFDGKYDIFTEGSSANTLTWLGSLLAAGSVVKPFRWELCFAMEVTIPNPCVHALNAAGVCTSCGYAEQDPLEGSWEAEVVLPAADLGVKTPDARLRCALTFSGGRVRAAWTAIDLTAFREFYHELFCNAYYACAYGSGITDLAQVEQICLETNGAGVSDYIYAFLDGFDINALFTPESTAGTYRLTMDGVYLDLELMGNLSDAAVKNPYTLQNGTLRWQAVSYGKPEHWFEMKK